jgi:molybdopterin/thiamine biosynthesis adenylyltransferase
LNRLTSKEIERYDRQIRIPSFGFNGQEKLRKAKVAVAGVGGLGCLAATYLTAAGVGRLVLIDNGKVELSNLNRQILHWEDDVGRGKVESAVEKLGKLNPHTKIEGKVAEIDAENVYSLIKGSDVVVDGMDNFKTRQILNEACVKLGIPFIHAAVHGFEGRLLTIIPGKGPCLQCLAHEEPAETKPTPVLGVTPAAMASLQVMETIKLITGIGEPLVGKLLVFNGLHMEFEEVTVRKQPNCPVCEKGKIDG